MSPAHQNMVRQKELFLVSPGITQGLIPVPTEGEAQCAPYKRDCRLPAPALPFNKPPSSLNKARVQHIMSAPASHVEMFRRGCVLLIYSISLLLLLLPLLL